MDIICHHFSVSLCKVVLTCTTYQSDALKFIIEGTDIKLLITGTLQNQVVKHLLFMPILPWGKEDYFIQIEN
jgi:hypothetical protein